MALNEWFFFCVNLLLFIRSMTAFKGDSKVMKLFAKHIKVSKGLWFLVGGGSDPYGPLPDLSCFTSASFPYLLSKRVLRCLPFITYWTTVLIFFAFPASAPTTVTTPLCSEVSVQKLRFEPWTLWRLNQFSREMLFCLDVNLLCPGSWP